MLIRQEKSGKVIIWDTKKNQYMCYDYCPLVWEKDGKGNWITYGNYIGGRLSRSYINRMLKIYDNHPDIATDITTKKIHKCLIFRESFFQNNFKLFQLSGSHQGIEKLDIPIKKIIDEDNVDKFKAMEEMYLLESQLDEPSHNKLKSITIAVSFPTGTGTIDLNLSILVYAIYASANKIIEYLKMGEVSIFSLEYASFVAIHKFNTVDQIKMNGLIHNWSKPTCGWTPLYTAIAYKKTDIIHFLLQRKATTIGYKNYSIADNYHILESLILWLKTKNNDAVVLEDALLTKRKKEVDILLEQYSNDKSFSILGSLLHEFYIALAEYWYKKSGIELSDYSADVPRDPILEAIAQAQFLFSKMDEVEKTKINYLDTQKVNTIKAQLEALEVSGKKRKHGEVRQTLRIGLFSGNTNNTTNTETISADDNRKKQRKM